MNNLPEHHKLLFLCCLEKKKRRHLAPTVWAIVCYIKMFCTCKYNYMINRNIAILPVQFLEPWYCWNMRFVLHAALLSRLLLLGLHTNRHWHKAGVHLGTTVQPSCLAAGFSIVLPSWYRCSYIALGFLYVTVTFCLPLPRLWFGCHFCLTSIHTCSKGSQLMCYFTPSFVVILQLISKSKIKCFQFCIKARAPYCDGISLIYIFLHELDLNQIFWR